MDVRRDPGDRCRHDSLPRQRCDQEGLTLQFQQDEGQCLDEGHSSEHRQQRDGDAPATRQDPRRRDEARLQDRKRPEGALKKRIEHAECDDGPEKQWHEPEELWQQMAQQQK